LLLGNEIVEFPGGVSCARSSTCKKKDALTRMRIENRVTKPPQ
jgi:hypothetical protein